MIYRVLGKYVNGLEITGFGVVDANGDVLKVKPEDFTNLVKKGLVQGFKCIEVDGENYVVPKGLLMSQIQILNSAQYNLKSSILNDADQVIGYEVISEDGNVLKLSKGKVWELAFEGVIKNAIAQYTDYDGSIKRLLLIYD